MEQPGAMSGKFWCWNALSQVFQLLGLQVESGLLPNADQRETEDLYWTAFLQGHISPSMRRDGLRFPQQDANCLPCLGQRREGRPLGQRQELVRVSACPDALRYPLVQLECSHDRTTPASGRESGPELSSRSTLTV